MITARTSNAVGEVSNTGVCCDRRSQNKLTVIWQQQQQQQQAAPPLSGLFHCLESNVLLNDFEQAIDTFAISR